MGTIVVGVPPPALSCAAPHGRNGARLADILAYQAGSRVQSRRMEAAQRRTAPLYRRADWSPSCLSYLSAASSR
jgi:hypothetical protein